MNQLEKKYGKYAIPNLTMYLIACYAVGYVLGIISPEMVNYLTLEPGYILRGQVWRLVTWLLIPPSSSNIFFTLIMLYFYYSIGRVLESVWGTYKLNVYLLSGLVFTILGSFILFFAFKYVTLVSFPIGFGRFFSTYYVNMSLFLAYAATFPDMRVYLFMMIPIKVKALGIIYGIILVMNCLQGGVFTWVVIGSSLLNFILFYFNPRNNFIMTPKRMKQKIQFTEAVKKTERDVKMAAITKHKCAVCGRSDRSNPELEFRFCSKCNGNYEYCQDHLFTHEHIK